MQIKTRAIVLNRENFIEASKLVTVYSAEYGKMKAIAVGSRKVNAKLLFATEPLVESDFVFLTRYPRNSLHKIIGGNIVNTREKIRTDFHKYLNACKVLETVDSLTREHSDNEKKYNLILRTLELLEIAANPGLIYNAFFLRFIKLCGFGLDFERKELYNNSFNYDHLRLLRLPGEEISKLEVSGEVNREIDIFCRRLFLSIAEKPLNAWTIED